MGNNLLCVSGVHQVKDAWLGELRWAHQMRCYKTEKGMIWPCMTSGNMSPLLHKFVKKNMVVNVIHPGAMLFHIKLKRTYFVRIIRIKKKKKNGIWTVKHFGHLWCFKAEYHKNQNNYRIIFFFSLTFYISRLAL